MAKASSDVLPSNGLHVVQGELSILLNSMRRPFKWSSQTYNQEEEQDVLLRDLHQLKEKLDKVSSLSELDLMTILGPFLEVIRSEDTSGPVTELALSAVFKFLSYGLIDPEHDAAAIAVESLAAAVTHARFVGTDSASDEVVMMKILHFLRMLVLNPAGVLLSNESICEIMQSCFRICFETRLSELLRKSAEHSLSEMVRLLYARLPQFPLQENKGLINYKKLKMRTSSYDPSRNKKKSRSPKPRPKTLPIQQNIQYNGKLESPTNPTVDTPLSKEAADIIVETKLESPCNADEETTAEESLNSPTATVVSMCTEPVETDKTHSVTSQQSGGPPAIDGAALMVVDELTSGGDYVNTQGVRFISTTEEEANRQKGAVHVPYGLPCVRELLHFLISLINPLVRQNSEAMIHVGTRLLTVAIETSADFIATVPSLLSLIQNEGCRHLFSLLNSERLSLLAASCRLCFLLFEAMRFRLKFQLELYLTKLMEVVVHESPRITFERRLIVLEAIAQLFRIPGLVTELYLNYDCDCNTSDLFEDMMKQLSKNAYPVSGIYATHLLSLEIILVVVDSIEAHCVSHISNQVEKVHDEKQKAGSNEVWMPPAARQSRFETTLSEDEVVTSHELLMANKKRKQLMIAGAELFNNRPSKGIQFLQENSILSNPLDPQQVASFLRENPRLDKKQIGEYISNRQNLIVLEAFARSFNFQSTRIDEALRLYLEAFRLPGEAPLISVIMEQFADHWTKCNDQPFASADAAFTLSYAVIMLNVDQHNANAKKQSTPMTSDAFKRNLSGVNGGKDFDHEMLEEIYQAICSDEIVMPAEQTGLVKENYLWRVLLRRGATKDGEFLHAPNDAFDADLFKISWAPTVTALSVLFDKASDDNVMEKVMEALCKISTTAAHFLMSDVFDHVMSTLIKFSTLQHTTESAVQQAISFGLNRKAQLATETLFHLVHRHGDNLREGWKQIVECILQFYRLKLLPDSLVETEDLFDPNTKIKLTMEEVPSVRSESFISSIYSYIALSDNPSGGKGTSPEDQEAIRWAKVCVAECDIQQLISDSKFLHTDALQEFIRVLIGSNDVAKLDSSNTDEYAVVFVLELIIRITVQNRDRVTCIWNQVRDHIYSLVMGAAAAERSFVLERSIVGLLLLTGRLMRREDVAPIVLQSLRMLLLLKPQVLSRVSRQVAFGLHELLKTGAANVHTTGDWRVLFTLLECVGAGAKPPSIRGVGSAVPVAGAGVTDGAAANDTETSDRGYTSDSELYEHRNRVAVAANAHGSNPELNVVPAGGGGGWIFVGREGEIEHMKGNQVPGQEYTIIHDRELGGHDPLAFVKACESLLFLVRDVAHITPENFESAVQCIRTFVEASLGASGQAHHPPSKAVAAKRTADQLRRSKSTSYDANDTETDDLPSSYHEVPLKLLDLMDTLHTRAAQIYQWWASEGGDDVTDNLANLCPSLWSRAWCPLLQGIARLCCDHRILVRTAAYTYLQRSLLGHKNLSACEWESCFNTVLFPLLTNLLALNNQPASEHTQWEETRTRCATLLSKVFLQHLGPLLQLSTFTALWMTLLEFMDKYMHAEHNDLLAEAIPEMMKNLLLVMETAGAFGSPPSEETPLWIITWDRIDLFLPELRQEVSRSKTPVARVTHDALPETSALETTVPQASIPDTATPTAVPEPSIQDAQQVSEVIPEAVSETVQETVAEAVSEMVSEAATEVAPEAVPEAIREVEVETEKDTSAECSIDVNSDPVTNELSETNPASNPAPSGVWSAAESKDVGSFFDSLPPLVSENPAGTGTVETTQDGCEKQVVSDNPLTCITNEFPILPIPVSPVQVKDLVVSVEAMADIKAQSSHFPLLLVNQVVGSSLPSLPILTPVRPEDNIS